MIKLELKPEFIQVIGEALANIPYKFSAPVIAEIQKQVNEQQAPAAPAALEEVD